MKRSEWMNELERNLYVLGREEREAALSYYAELINDKLESGEREEYILASFGSPKDVALDIITNGENAECRSSAHNGPRKNVINEPVFEDDYFRAAPEPACDGYAAPPLKKKKKNVFVHIILPVIGALVGAYLIFSVVLTIIDVSTKKTEFYESDAAFVGLLLDVGASNVEVRTGDKYTVSYTTSAIRGVSIADDGEKLSVKDDRFVFSSWAWWDYKMIVTVPEVCTELDVSVSAGSLDIENCAFKSTDIDVSAGNLDMENCTLGVTKIDISAGSVEMKDVSVTSVTAKISAGDFDFERMSVETVFDASVSAGDIEGSIVGKKEDFSVTANVSAGSCNLENIVREVDKRITLDVSAGSVNLSFVG